MINAEKRDLVIETIKANPMLSDVAIAAECEINRNAVAKIRREAGLWTHQRIRYKDGKARIYRVQRSKNVKTDECLSVGKCSEVMISDEMLVRLHDLRLDPCGQEAWQLIQDVLEISEANRGPILGEQ